MLTVSVPAYGSWLALFRHFRRCIYYQQTQRKQLKKGNILIINNNNNDNDNDDYDDSDSDSDSNNDNDNGNDNKQLLVEVEHDIMNYQNRGLCYLPKPKAEADNRDTRFR